MGGGERSWLQQVVYDLSRIAVRWLGRMLFGLRLAGSEKFPDQGGALVCSNHQSYFDPILLGALCDRRMNYLARETLFQSRWFGGLIRFYDAIPVKRDGMSISGLKQTLQRLRRGELVLIFPEGTRTEDGEIGQLKSGFCMLARKAGVPLVPVGIAGAYEMWPKGKKLPRLARLCLWAGEPISVESVAELDDDALVRLVDERMRHCFHQANSLRQAQPGFFSALIGMLVLPGVAGYALAVLPWLIGGGESWLPHPATAYGLVCVYLGCLTSAGVAILLAARNGDPRLLWRALGAVWGILSLFIAVINSASSLAGRW